MLAGFDFDEVEENQKTRPAKPRDNQKSTARRSPSPCFNEEQILEKLDTFQHNLLHSIRYYRRKVETQLQKLEDKISRRTRRVPHHIRGPNEEEELVRDYNESYPPPRK